MPRNRYRAPRRYGTMQRAHRSRRQRAVHIPHSRVLTHGMAFVVGTLIAILGSPVSDLLNSMDLPGRFLVGFFLFLCALGLVFTLRAARVPIIGIVEWVAVGASALGVILMITAPLDVDLSLRFLFGAVLIISCIVVYILGYKRRTIPILAGLVRWGLSEVFALGVVLMLTDVFKLSVLKTATCAFIIFIIILIIGTTRRWVRFWFWIPESVREHLDGWGKQIRAAFRNLTRLFPAAIPPKIIGAVLGLVACIVLILFVIVFRSQIRTAFDASVSLASTIQQNEEYVRYGRSIVFMTLGLASVAVLLAAFINIVYAAYSRRLTAVLLVVAFLAMAVLFCTYMVPPMFTGADKIAKNIIPSATPTLTLTPTPTPTQVMVTTPSTPTLTPEEPSKTPISTREPLTTTPISPTPTWTPIPSPQPKTPPPVDTPTRIQPPTSVPTEIPTPTRIQPPTSVPTEVPTPTRIQPPPPPPAEIPTPTRIQPQTSMAVLTGRSSSNYQVPR